MTKAGPCAATLALFVLLAHDLPSQQSTSPKHQSPLLLTNDSIVKLVKGRVSEDTIISVIKSTARQLLAGG